MQDEIDALLRAFAAEQEREARLIHELLTTLGQRSGSRQRMIESLALAVAEAMSSAETIQPRTFAAHEAPEQLSEAVARLRARSNGYGTH